MDDFQYGRWINGSTNCGLKALYSHQKGPTNDWANYCWQPHKCIAPPFSIKEFCGKLKGKTVLFAGDSLLYQMFLATIYQVENRTVEVIKQIQDSKDAMPLNKICDDTVSLSFMRSDRLTLELVDTPRDITKPLCAGQFICNARWIGALPNIDILVLNKGHHLREVSEEQFLQDSFTAAEYIGNYTKSGLSNRKGRQALQVYFVTTSPGHPFCSGHSEPNLYPYTSANGSSNLMNYEATLNDPRYEMYYKHHFWHRYGVHDEYQKRIFRTYSNATIIDVAPMSALRPDGHRFATDLELQKNPTASDCLHYHEPGPVDNWVKLFFNLLS